MKKKILILSFLIIGLMFKANSAPSAVIKFKVVANQRLLLGYKTARQHTNWLAFINTGKKDSVITNTVDLPDYTLVNYTIATFIEGKNGLIQNTFYIKNGDTIVLETDKNYHLISKSQGIPIVENLIEDPDRDQNLYSKLRTLQQSNILLYFQQIKYTYLASKQRIDSIYNLKRIDSVLKEVLYQQADLQFNLMNLSPIINGLKIPLTKINEVDSAAKRLDEEPAIIKKLDPLKSIFTLGNWCAYQILKTGKPLNIKTLTAQTLKSKWSKPEIVASILNRLDGHNDPDNPLFIDSYHMLAQYANEKEVPQLAVLRKTYFPKISLNKPILLLRPDNTSTDLSAELRKNKGKIVVIDFWASWCVPCRQAFPDLKKIKIQFRHKPVTFFGISLDSDAKTAAWITALQQEKLFKEKNQFKLINTKGSALFDSLEIPSIPRYIVLNSQGKILNASFYGPGEHKFVTKLNSYLKGGL